MVKFTLQTLLYCLLAQIALAQKKVSIGLDLNIFQPNLNNIDKNSFSGYGHSVPDFTQKNCLGYAINGKVQIPIYKGVGIQTGLGLSKFQSQFHFNYIHPFTNWMVDENLNIKTIYFEIPLQLFYEITLSKKSSIIVSGGVSIRTLLNAKDNFNQIVIEEIFLTDAQNRYQKTLYSYRADLSYRYYIKSNQSVELGINFGKDNSFVKQKPISTEDFGFYKNLHASYYSQIGVSIRYFFHLL